MKELIKEEEVFDCCRFKVVHRVYKNEAGKEIPRFSVIPGDAVIVLPVDENNEIYFIEQMRESVGKVCLELPAGMIDNGENSEIAAKRELEEEVGIVADKLELLYDGYPSAGYTSEKVYIYVAKKFSKGTVHLDDTEEIDSIKKISLDKAMEMVLNNEFEEINIAVAILTYYNKYGKK